ncbi:MAG TPA: hypothetical protein VHV75_16390 [Solirubrobacteraceae bacterium]|jgi:hypothetical protein|nr:hypothetical protein [Solirubrobacteraceae bacterium]
MSEQPERHEPADDPATRANATHDPGSGPTLSASLPVGAGSEKLRRFPVPHAQKFRVALAMLCGIGLGAVGIAVAILAAHGSNRNVTTAAAGHWSSWAPSTGGSNGVTEIADHIAPYYRISGSQQLDAITPISVSEATAAGTTTGSGLTVVVNTNPSSKSQSLSLLNGKTVAYNICGLGPKNCELAGKASTSRMLLLRREALELALYTFKYVSSAENVLAVLPPGKTTAASSSSSSSAAGTKVTVSVLFVRKELQPWLDTPLSKTLQTYPPEVSALPLWSKTDEAALVDQVTANGLFSSQVESQQEGGNLLVLSPLPPQ